MQNTMDNAQQEDEPKECVLVSEIPNPDETAISSQPPRMTENTPQLQLPPQSFQQALRPMISAFMQGTNAPSSPSVPELTAYASQKSVEVDGHSANMLCSAPSTASTGHEDSTSFVLYRKDGGLSTSAPQLAQFASRFGGESAGTSAVGSFPNSATSWGNESLHDDDVGNHSQEIADVYSAAARMPHLPQETVRKAFVAADRDQSGNLDFREFLEASQALQLNVPYLDALQCFSKLDTNKDGRINEAEFIAGYIKDGLGTHIWAL